MTAISDTDLRKRGKTTHLCVQRKGWVPAFWRNDPANSIVYRLGGNFTNVCVGVFELLLCRIVGRRLG